MKNIYLKKANEIIESIIKKQKRCGPGSLPWLLHRNKISEQSFYIKFGRNFEKWFKYVVENSIGFKLLPDGVTKNVVKGKSKDIDLIFLNEKKKEVYYFELKSNIDLDTEKFVVTIDKVHKIRKYLNKLYPQYKIESGILHWAVYEKSILDKKYLTKIKQAENSGVTINYPKDFFEILKQDISEKDYYNMFNNIKKTYLIK